MNPHEKSSTVRIIEVYASIQGESTAAGRPCVFVRLAGCDLRCTYCDSEFTFTGGERRDIDALVAEVHAHGIKMVEVTGGEPLLQRTAPLLMSRLLEAGHDVYLETSGSHDISVVPKGVVIVMDLKAPGSGEHLKNNLKNLALLTKTDELKCVVLDRDDYVWCRDLITKHNLYDHCEVLFSPVHGILDPSNLVDWVVADKLNARVQLQLHKYIWDPVARGV